MEIGIQVSSLKPLLTTEEEVREAFWKIRNMGVSLVQIQWISKDISAQTIQNALVDTGLRSVSVQDFYESVREDEAYYLDLLKKTKGKWFCVSRVPERLKSREGLFVYVKELRELAKKMESEGMKLCFHPVQGDYDKIGGVSPVPFLLEAIPEMDLCLDLYHAAKKGESLPSLIQKYGSRICMVHFKDEKEGDLVPCGQGEIDYQGVPRACIQAGVPYAFVEQERHHKDPFESLYEGVRWLEEEMNKGL